MAVKNPGIPHIPDFSVELTDDRGAVRLRAKPRAKSLYEWQYTTDVTDPKSWKVAKKTDVSITNYGDLEAGIYWFRVIYLTGGGEINAYDPVKIAVL
jgi:hypothetical protein